MTLILLSTLKDGDCAFHAIFGNYDSATKEVSLQNVDEKRREIADIVSTVTEESNEDLFNAVLRAIETLYMDDAKVHGLGGALLQIGELYNSAIQNQHEFSLNTLATTEKELFEKALNQYANFIGTPKQWLNECDVAVVAHAANVGVNFYIQNSTDGSLIFHGLLGSTISNTIVSIVFDGMNHFMKINLTAPLLPPIVRINKKLNDVPKEACCKICGSELDVNNPENIVTCPYDPDTEQAKEDIFLFHRQCLLYDFENFVMLKLTNKTKIRVHNQPLDLKNAPPSIKCCVSGRSDDEVKNFVAVQDQEANIYYVDKTIWGDRVKNNIKLLAKGEVVNAQIIPLGSNAALSTLAIALLKKNLLNNGFSTKLTAAPKLTEICYKTIQSTLSILEKKSSSNTISIDYKKLFNFYALMYDEDGNLVLQLKAAFSSQQTEQIDKPYLSLSGSSEKSLAVGYYVAPMSVGALPGIALLLNHVMHFYYYSPIPAIFGAQLSFVVFVLGVCFGWYSAKTGREISFAVNNAQKIFKNALEANNQKERYQLHTEVEKTLAAEFNRWFPVRAARSLILSKEIYGMTHLLRAENASMLGDGGLAWAEFSDALNDALCSQNKLLKLGAIIGKVKLLSHYSRIHLPTNLDRNKELLDAVNLLNKEFPDLYNQYSDFLLNGLQKIVVSISDKKSFSEQNFLTEMNQFLRSRDFYIFRYSNNSRTASLEIIYLAVQTILLTLFETQNSALEETTYSSLLDEFQLAENEKPSALLLAIKKFEQFITCLKCYKEKFQTKEDYPKEMIATLEDFGNCYLLAIPANVIPGSRMTELNEKLRAIKTPIPLPNINPSNVHLFFGIDKQINEISNFLTQVINNPDQEQHFLLLEGPPGTGKTAVVQYVVEKLGLGKPIEWKRAEYNDCLVAQISKRVRDFFNLKQKGKKLTVLFMDEIDSICPKNTNQDGYGYNQAGDIQTIQVEITKLKGQCVVLIGATNFIENMAAAIKSRAGTPVAFKLPDYEARLALFSQRLQNKNIPKDHIEKLAKATCSWSSRQIVQFLETVCTLPQLNSDIIETYFNRSRTSFENEMKKEYSLDGIYAPKLKFNDMPNPLASLSLKEEIKEEVMVTLAYLKNPEDFLQRIPDAKFHMLLYGPPGTGKTTIARCLAESADCLFISISGGCYKHPHTTATLQKLLTACKQFERAILFIDEIDTLASETSWAREILQTSMDGFDKGNNLIVIGTTNYLQNIAPPMLRRFSRIEIPLPDGTERAEVFYQLLKNIQERDNTIQLDADLKTEYEKKCPELGNISNDLSQGDITSAFHDYIKKITAAEIESQNGKPQVTILPLQDLMNIIQEKIQQKNRPETCRLVF